MANITEILTEIRDRHGILTPEIVRDEARPEDSPIHAYVFNVDRGEAAEAYYLERAHQLIQRARVIVRQAENDAPRRVRAFLAVPSEEARYAYEPVAEVVSDAEKFRMVRTEAARRLREAESSLDDLDALARDTPFAGSSAKARKAVRAARRELDKVA